MTQDKVFPSAPSSTDGLIAGENVVQFAGKGVKTQHEACERIRMRVLCTFEIADDSNREQPVGSDAHIRF